jgi:hypothetical protein
LRYIAKACDVARDEEGGSVTGLHSTHLLAAKLLVIKVVIMLPAWLICAQLRIARLQLGLNSPARN